MSQVQIKELIKALEFSAPKLSPDFWNKSIASTLSAASPPVSVKDVMKMKKSSKCCSLCQAQLETSSALVDYKLKSDSSGAEVKSLIIVCPACLSVKDLASLLELVTAVSAHPTNKKLQASLASVALHFLKVNGHDLSNAQAFHSAISTAFTLSQLCGSLPLVTPISFQ